MDYLGMREGQVISVRVYLQVRKSAPITIEIDVNLLVNIQPSRFHLSLNIVVIFQQLQKLPIEPFFADTVPDGTLDCESSSSYNLDQV